MKHPNMDREHLTETLRRAGFLNLHVEEACSRSGARVLGRRIGKDRATTVWRSLLAVRESTGFHPLLTPLPPSMLVAGELAEPDVFDDRAVTAPREVVAEVTAAALADALAYAGEPDEAEEWRAEFDPQRLAQKILPEPEPVRIREFLPDWLCLVETRDGWSVPQLLPGYPYAPNWEHGPEGRPMLDSDHVAFLHTWHDRFRAELLFVSERVLMLDVARPPQEPLAVAEAAIEQYAYCPDASDPVTYAKRQSQNRTWQFAWD
ncbi:DUF4253 domain-containing protein [Streptomyces sp. NPDC052016]|uniref:DUF4253 domain-containing protein n=1 Tax=Streptomyces sp. NPDC052016 TaxID=3365680 RepID=UPI0037CE51E7